MEGGTTARQRGRERVWGTNPVWLGLLWFSLGSVFFPFVQTTFMLYSLSIAAGVYEIQLGGRIHS